MSIRTNAGSAYPLGAHCADDGVNFALFSAHAERVELCLFNASDHAETARIELADNSDDVWHVHVSGIGPGTLYGYRVHGPYQPQLGHRFNVHKLLLDPYARLLSGELSLSDLHYGYRRDDSHDDLSFDDRDNAAQMPKCVVVGDPGSTPARLRTRAESQLIYETHVRGYTMRHPEVPETLRGTFAGLAMPGVIEHIRALGVSAVELMPVQYFADEAFLSGRGLRNYWGYNSLGFFAPSNRYLSNADPGDFQDLVKRFHDAGIEILMDVVYNHTAEGNHLGPTLCFRGIDNASYYRLEAQDSRLYVNDTGCGNTLNLSQPRVLQMVMDSLRYWVGVMGVDGFRFDLATTLGREHYGFDAGSGFFDVLRQDPLLASVRLIAEPWDLGPGGYQLGQFPAGWSEWNDRYRDTVRRFWRGDEGLLPELAQRLHGSSDLFEHNRRRPAASINFVTSHDGFTLADLVSYGKRHNEANGEQSRDGHQSNFSANHGVEGPSDDPLVNALRRRQRRNLLATMFLSQGTPMLLAGDEFGRSQDGNNNAYCQDNETAWLDWSARDPEEQAFARFVGRLAALRRDRLLLRWPYFIHNVEAGAAVEAAEFHWLHSSGEYMHEHDWRDHLLKCIGMQLLGPTGKGDAGQREQLLVLLNADSESIRFNLPVTPAEGQWAVCLNTAVERDFDSSDCCAVVTAFELPACSVCVLELIGQEQ